MRKPIIAGFLSLIVSLSGCEKDPTFNSDSPYQLNLPKGFPMPAIPADNQLTSDRVELGKLLFFDAALSVDSTVSCASCHLPHLAFSYDVALSMGVNNSSGFRNAPSLGNVAYHPYLFRDGGVPTLEHQVLAPIEDPVEMAFSVPGVVERMLLNPLYVSLSRTAYGREPDAFVLTRSLAAYERTLITGDSPFDRYYYRNDENAMSASAKQGFELFTSAKTSCSSCHSGFNFTDYSFRNIGLYEVYADTGRKRITQVDDDYGKFKVPSLRNVEFTAPYMHDGSIATLNEVIDHFNSGGENNIHKDSLMRPLNLTTAEKQDILNFLRALSDISFIQNEAFVP